jgi:hypothetical protein
MVQAPMSELSIMMIEVQLALWGNMHRHFAGDQAGLIFFTEDLLLRPSNSLLSLPLFLIQDDCLHAVSMRTFSLSTRRTF